jgi:hypothetical protein
LSGSANAVCRAALAELDAIDAHWRRNILKALLADINEIGRHLALHLPPDVLGNRDATRLCNAFDPRRDVDAVAQDIVTLDDDIANIDPDPQPDWIGVGATGVLLHKLFLDFDGAGDGVHGAGEFHQRAVAHELDDTAGMRGDRRIDQLAPQIIQPGQSARLVHAHEARITDHVGGQDCRKPPLQAPLRHLDRSSGSRRGATVWATGQGLYRGRHVRDESFATWTSQW